MYTVKSPQDQTNTLLIEGVIYIGKNRFWTTDHAGYRGSLIERESSLKGLFCT